MLTLTVIDGRRIGVSGPASLIEKLVHYPGATFLTRNGGSQLLSLPFENTAILAVEAVGTGEVSEEYGRLRRMVLRPRRADLNEVEAKFLKTGDGQVPPLMLHQWEYLAHHWRNTSSFNASEQGLGKTRMALELVRIWGSNRVIVIMPKSLAAQWEEEIKQVWPAEVRPRFVDATRGTYEQRTNLIRFHLPTGKYQETNPVILAVNYDVLVSLEPFLKAFWADTIIADESWKIKNPKAKMTKAAIRLADHTRAHYATKLKVPRIIALAGTPIGNDVGDLWSQLRFLGRQFASDSYNQFLFRYAELKQVHIPGRTVLQPVGVNDPAGLMMRLAPVWFRATKATCLDLPRKVRQRVLLDLPAATQSLYREVENEGEAALGHETSLNGEAVVTMRLQQITGGHRPSFNTDDWELEPITNCPKLAWIKDWAEANLTHYPTARCIVWCRFRAEVKRVSEALGDLIGQDKVCAVDGDTKTAVLDGLKKSFNSREENGIRVIVATTSKLAYGHNLQAADWMVYFSGTWSYIEHAQSEDRAHRLGREGDVNYIHLIAKDTVDEDIYRALEEHRDVAVRLAPCVATPRG